MPKLSKKIATIYIILLCVAAVYGTRMVVAQMGKGALDGADIRAKGDRKAPITVVEFIDFQCPACATGAAYLKEISEKHPAAFRVEVNHYPLNMHQHGLLSSKYVECAARQGKFWSYQDILLARQGNWSRLASADPAFDKIAEEVKLNMDDLKACLADEEVDAVILKNKDEGTRLGVRSTPTYFVNGKMVVGKNALDMEINQLLEKHGY